MSQTSWLFYKNDYTLSVCLFFIQLKMLNPFKCFNGWGSRLEKSQDPKSWE